VDIQDGQAAAGAGRAAVSSWLYALIQGWPSSFELRAGMISRSLNPAFFVHPEPFDPGFSVAVRHPAA